MDIHEERKGAVMVLRPLGPLTLEDADQFKSRFLQVRADRLGRLVVDASAIPYVDSRGLEVLVEANEQMNESGQSLKLCGLEETLREVLDVTELSSLFEQYEDVASAVRSFL